MLHAASTRGGAPGGAACTPVPPTPHLTIFSPTPDPPPPHPSAPGLLTLDDCSPVGPASLIVEAPPATPSDVTGAASAAMLATAASLPLGSLLAGPGVRGLFATASTPSLEGWAGVAPDWEGGNGGVEEHRGVLYGLGSDGAGEPAHD